MRETEFIARATRGRAPELSAAALAGRPWPPGVALGPGDDAALLPDGTLLSVDCVVEGVHFDPGTAPSSIARKALGRPLSDLAAMGAEPLALLVAAMLPPGCDAAGLADGLADWSQRFGVPLVGGDTCRGAPGALALCVTAAGRCAQGAPWLRSGGRPGDSLHVSGPLGGARAGRHLAVSPRFDLVVALRDAGVVVHAAIDVSDGLARNLAILARASGCGARLQASAIPVHDEARTAPDPLRSVLVEGEDFELLLALPAGQPVPPGLVAIGELQAGETLTLERAGVVLPWPGEGHEHEF